MSFTRRVHEIDAVKVPSHIMGKAPQKFLTSGHDLYPVAPWNHSPQAMTYIRISRVSVQGGVRGFRVLFRGLRFDTPRATPSGA